MGTPKIQRSRTALSRGELSRPVRLALRDGVLFEGRTFFDFGCGKGDDVRGVGRLGYDASGWDPAFAPNAKKRPADIVNLGYVLNVVEEPAERVAVLREAWELAGRCLVVSVRLELEGMPDEAKLFGDGFVTRRGTFQKLYNQSEARSWVEATLGRTPHAAAPGVFYVFRDEEMAADYFRARYFTRVVLPRRERLSDVYRLHADILEPLLRFLLEHGRGPDEDEIPQGSAAYDVVGGLRGARKIVHSVVSPQDLLAVHARLRTDLGVYLAVSLFQGRVQAKAYPTATQRDLRAVFGNFQRATKEATQILYGLGDPEAMAQAFAGSSVGKLTPAALYVHESAALRLPPLLRVMEGVARSVVGAADGCNLIKLNRLAPSVSYLAYPGFDEDAHPELAYSLKVTLPNARLRFRDFRGRANRPLLHRKETFVAADYLGRERFVRLTSQEERAGLLADTAKIGLREGWQAALVAAGYRVAGHRLLRLKGSTF